MFRVAEPAVTSHAETRKIYFKGFNTLRFYAAMSVIVQHISYSPHDWFGTPLLPETLERLFVNGTDAVNLFFVLSGFLITYLLLAEKQRTGTVNVRNFYIRRAFRIYPVYFVYIFITVLALNQPYPPQLLFLLIFFMGNVAFVKYFPFPPLEHLWSIGVEEQFYLLAPLMARHQRSLVRLLVTIIVLWWVMMLIFRGLPPSSLGIVVYLSRYDLIALGALMGYAHFHQWEGLRLLSHPVAVALAIAMIIYAAVFVPPTMEFFYSTLLGLAYVVVVYNVASRDQLPRFLTNPTLEALGNWSYSMYVYHPLLIFVFFTLFHDRLSAGTYPLIAYPVIIGLTLAISWASYRYLESPFLRLKGRFKRV